MRRFKGRARFLARNLTAAIAMSAMLVVPAHADVESTMKSFFSKSGAASNVNGPAAFQGQSAGYYSGGSLWARFPTENVRPFNLQLPSARGGCGGIDLFAGSFSFINTDQIVATMKAVANNAIGYAFQLAIDSISAEIGGVMKDMSQRIQQLNQFNMNSCQMAQQALANIVPWTDGASQRICQDLGKQTGKFRDEAWARHNCANGGERMGTLAGVNENNQLAARNYTWDALMKLPGGAPSENYSELLMTLVGTVIWVPGTSDEDPGQYRFIEPAGGDFLTALIDGTPGDKPTRLNCDETTKCLNPAPTPFTITKGYHQMVKDLISSMEAKTKLKGSTLSSDEIALLGMTTIPLYKILVVNAASQFNAVGDMGVISEAVALDVLMSHVDKMLDDVQRSKSNMQKVPADQAKEWSEKVQAVRQTLSDRHRRAQQGLGNTYAIIQRTMHLEATLRNSLSPEMSASLNFGRAIPVSVGQ